MVGIVAVLRLQTSARAAARASGSWIRIYARVGWPLWSLWGPRPTWWSSAARGSWCNTASDVPFV